MVETIGIWLVGIFKHVSFLFIHICISQQHELAMEFYIIVTGQCSVTVIRSKKSSNKGGGENGEGSEVAGDGTRRVGTLRELDFFGLVSTATRF